MEEREQEALRELGAARVGEIHCITIIGQVEGHVMLPPDTKTTKYEHIMPLLAAVEEAEDIRALLILLNTVGGDIEAGLCLAEMIAGMSKPTASVVLGGGHSIGVPLAVAADRSFIVPSAAVTIHPVRLTGVVIGVPQTWLSTSSKCPCTVLTFGCLCQPQNPEPSYSIVMKILRSIIFAALARLFHHLHTCLLTIPAGLFPCRFLSRQYDLLVFL